MAVNNGIIAAPISASDPYYAMGIGQYNGTYDVGWACSNNHGKINIWSKRKPVYHSNSDELTDEHFNFVMYGLEYYSSANINDIISNTVGNANGWKYIKADSQPYYWFRLTDFIGYNHNAKAPIINFSASSTSLNTDPTSTIGGNVILNIDDDAIKLNTIDNFKDYYFGIIIVAGNTTKYGTSGLPIGDSSALVSLVNAYRLPTGIAYVYPVLCKLPFVNTSSGINNGPGGQLFHTLPNTFSKTVIIRDSFITISIEAQGYADGSVTYDLSVSNNISGEHTTFNNNFVWLRFAKNNINDPIQQGEQRQSIPEFVLSPGSYKDTSGTFYVNDRMTPYRVWVTLKNSTYTKSIGVIMPMN